MIADDVPVFWHYSKTQPPPIRRTYTNFSDWFVTTQGNLIDNPGILYVNCGRTR